MTENEFVHYDHYQSTVVNYVDSVTIEEARECVGGFQKQLNTTLRRSIWVRERTHFDELMYYDDWRGSSRSCLRAVCWLGIMISFTLQAVKNLHAHPKFLRLELFCKFFGDFSIYLGINSFFLKRISKIHGNRKFWRFSAFLKLDWFRN